MSLAAINIVVMGAVALTFMRGPFFNREQELWYRFGSLGFLVFGAVAPAALMYRVRSRPAMLIATGWLIGAWLPFLGYLLASGGGM